MPKTKKRKEYRVKTKNEMEKVCSNLVNLANKLNERGFDRLAEHVTGLLKIALRQ